MTIPGISLLHRGFPRLPRVARRLAAGGAAVILLTLPACGHSTDPGGGDDAATLSGRVQAAESGAPLADATVSIGARQATTNADGNFELADVPIGAATVQIARAGYVAVQVSVAVTAGANSHDFTLTAQEIYSVGSYVVYVPAGVSSLRGTIIALGGPVTSGFVNGERIAPPDNPALETSLQALGSSLRALARSAHVALLGSQTVLADDIASDNALLAALSTVAGQSGRPELAEAPVLPFGLSAGAREASGLAARNPARTIALLVRVPVGVTTLTTAATLAVPAFVMQAELDEVVSNAGVRGQFATNRSAGGLWSLAVEPGVGHHVATARGNAAAIAWLGEALALRLPATAAGPLVALPEPSGWLGDQTTLDIAPWADFPGDRSAASWLLSATTAESWKGLATSAGGG